MKYFSVDFKRTSTRVGFAIGFVFFLIVGVIPSLLFGGHFGRIIIESLLGHSIEGDPTILPKLFVCGGMVIGFTLSFLVCILIGALVGSSVNTVKSGVQKSD